MTAIVLDGRAMSADLRENCVRMLHAMYKRVGRLLV